jgi:hypothetical protein
MSRKTTITNARPAGADHEVVTLLTQDSTGKTFYRRTPCADCPWRVDAVGEFPAEAIKHSASTAYDMAENTFACHSSGAKRPATCAGFLLRGAAHNLAVRLAYIQGHIQDDLDEDGHELFNSYREMAIANGVDPDDPALAKCRD